MLGRIELLFTNNKNLNRRGIIMSGPVNGRVPVGQRTGGGVPARGGYPGNVGGGARRGGGVVRGGRGVRQVAGHDSGFSFFRRSRPSRHSTVFVDSGPSVSVVHTSRPGRISSIAALIVGVALAVLGAGIFPVDPIAGLVIGGLGVLMTASAGTVYGVNYRD